MTEHANKSSKKVTFMVNSGQTKKSGKKVAFAVNNEQVNKSGEILKTEVDRFVEDLLNRNINLNRLVQKNPERKVQLVEKLESIVEAREKEDIKRSLKEFIKKLEEFGVKMSPYQKGGIPILWSNMNKTKKSLTGNLEYNRKIPHYGDTDSPIFDILWKIVPKIINFNNKRIVETNNKREIKKSYYQIMSEEGEKIGVKHIPYDKLLSEVFVETISLNDIINGELRIEFGQNINGRKANEVCFATDAVMAVSELPILLDRIAQYNIENPGKEIYLENVGVSIGEINSGKFEDISGRYGKGENGESKNNEGANLIIVEAVERGEKGEILREHNKTVLSLKDLILKREKQRLKECIKRLEKEENKEKILEDPNIDNWSDNENEQHNFIEKARQKQEIDYLIEEESKQKNFSADEEKESFIKKRKKELKEEFKTKKSLIDKSEEDDFIKWTAKYQEELEKKEEEKVKSLQDKIKEILEQGEQNIGKSQTQLVSERGEENKNQTTEMTVG